MDGLGDKLKAYEERYEQVAIQGIPLIARLDGRAFHTLTRKMERPYDKRLQACMHGAAVALLEDLHPCVAYTQSDEITVAWTLPPDSKSEYPFGGRIQKLCSVLASIATEAFNRAFTEHFDGTWYTDAQGYPNKSLATFDCRVFQVPNADEALNVFIWREDDAVKNSVSMLAQSHFSDKELFKKNIKEKLQMLESKGIIWGNQDVHFKRGVFLKRFTVSKELAPQELASIPERHRPAPGITVQRSVVQTAGDIGRLRGMDRTKALEALGLTSVPPR